VLPPWSEHTLPSGWHCETTVLRIGAHLTLNWTSATDCNYTQPQPPLPNVCDTPALRTLRSSR